jgi:hypothetical protein
MICPFCKSELSNSYLKFDLKESHFECLKNNCCYIELNFEDKYLLMKYPFPRLYCLIYFFNKEHFSIFKKCDFFAFSSDKKIKDFSVKTIIKSVDDVEIFLQKDFNNIKNLLTFI